MHPFFSSLFCPTFCRGLYSRMAPRRAGDVRDRCRAGGAFGSRRRGGCLALATFRLSVWISHPRDRGRLLSRRRDPKYGDSTGCPEWGFRTRCRDARASRIRSWHCDGRERTGAIIRIPHPQPRSSPRTPSSAWGLHYPHPLWRYDMALGDEYRSSTDS